MTYIFSQGNQSPWIVDIYNKFLNFKKNGFLVEIGVGHTIDGLNHSLTMEDIKNLGTFKKLDSNTADLLDLGWGGIYIDPVLEFCEEARYCHSDKLDRLHIINTGVSDEEQLETLHLGESFLFKAIGGVPKYDYVGRQIKTRITSKVLSEYNCPKHIDVMSIDVEGFEEKVIKGIDFNLHLPKILVVEINVVPESTISSIIPAEYKLIQSDGLNAGWVYLENEA